MNKALTEEKKDCIEESNKIIEEGEVVVLTEDRNRIETKEIENKEERILEKNNKGSHPPNIDK